VVKLYGSGQTFKTKDKDGRFQWNVCDKADGASSNTPKAGLIDKTKSVVLGFYDKVSGGAVGTDDGETKTVYFRYSGDDVCKNNISREATVIAICDKTKTTPEFAIVTDPDASCSYTFILKTNSFCNVSRTSEKTTAAPATTTPVAAPSKSSHMGPVAGFFLFLLAVAVGYCVIGFLYKRYVLGARGAQQIPNYLFWIRVTQAIQDCVSNRSSARYTTTSRTAEYDRANAADVQLMNDGDDLKYDQPPLVVGPGAGQTSTFRQQPLNVVPSANTPSMNAPRQQQQPLLLPQDDADERLLQV